MEERILKLLILAGDEGSENEPRDFNRIVQIIVEEYLQQNDLLTTNTIIFKLSTVISKIPLKHHLYAGLTAKISEKNREVSNQIIQIQINNLQKSLGEFEFYESINVLNYLSELMNISLLNSLTFMNILEDIFDKVEESSNPQAKRFYSSVLVRSLPVCLSSLSEKLFQDLKKFMDLLSGHIQNDSLFSYMKGLVNKSKIVNFSSMVRLGQSFSNLQQFNVKRKLKIEEKPEKLNQWAPVEYFNMNRQIQDELYKEFCEQEGRVHQLIVQQIVETFYPRGTILVMKLINYLNSVPSHKEVFLYHLTISTLISKCLKSSRPIVQQSLLQNLVNNFNQKMSEEAGNLTKVELAKMLEDQIYEIFSKGESLDFSGIINLANLISFLVNNLKQQWDWERYLQNQSTFVRRRVILLLTLQKIKVLNDNFVLPQIFSQYPHYEIPQKLTNQMNYKTAEQMQTFESFEEALKAKSGAQKINEMINSEQKYEVFLQTLFRRTSLSHTHLKTLIQRYKDLLTANKQYDWALINKIRNFWKKSFLNRQLYLQMMIKSGFITFNSYANYISQLKDKNEREMIWIKIQLNELNNMFGNSKKTK